MVFFPSFLSAIAKSGAQVAAAAGPIPGLGAVGEIITAIILLCDAVPQNRYSPISIPRFFSVHSLSNSLVTGMLLATWPRDASACAVL